MSTARDRIEAKLGLTGQPLQPIRAGPPKIPDHDLVRPIGQGAYGEVWLARNALGTRRAIKIVYLDNFRDSRPYEREFAGIRRFEPLSRANEGFVDILQVGRDEPGGWFYYVMELADDARCRVDPPHHPESPSPSPAPIDSSSPDTPPDSENYRPRTLADDLLRRGRLPLTECLELGLNLSLALAHLHRHGLIHRDVKPSNIIFVGGVPKLADIGLVTEVAGARTFVGTEGFVPPEGPTSPGADLYALGKVLYEAAMGKDRQEFPEPFTRIGTDPESIQLMELNAVLLRACEPQSEARYASAEEMHADLALLHSGGSVKRRHQFDRQFQTAKRVGTAAIAAMLLIGGAWLWQRQQTQRMTRLAEEKSTLATEKTKLADDLARLDAENRNRIVRLDIANGVRLLDDGDPAGALLWFADALPLLVNHPADQSVHRIRINQTLKAIPRPIHVFPHGESPRCLAFSEDGRRVATGTDWGYLRVWDADSGAPLWEPLEVSRYLVAQTRFTHDGRCVFASSLPAIGFFIPGAVTNHVSLTEVGTGRSVVSLAETNLIRADLSPDDRWLVTADTQNVIQIRDARDGRRLHGLVGHTGKIVQFAFSTDGSVLASSSEDGTIRTWRLPSGEPMGAAISHDPKLGPMALSPDGKTLVSATNPVEDESNTMVLAWEVATGERVGLPITMPGRFAGLAWFTRNGRPVLFILTREQCALLDPDSHERLGRVISLPERAYAYALPPDGRLIAMGGDEGFLGAWRLETGERILPSCLAGRRVTEMSYSPDGSRLLVATSDGAVRLLPGTLPTDDARHRLDAGITEGPPKPLLEWRRFTPDLSSLLLKLQDKTLRRVDFEQMTDFRLPDSPFEVLAPIQFTWDQSGRRGAVFRSDGTTHLVELWGEQGDRTNRFSLPHPVALNSQMCFTPDGDRLLTPGNDGLVRIWRTADGSLERSFDAQDPHRSVRVFPDGRTIFAVHPTGVGFVLWDMVTGAMTRTPLPNFNITAFCFDSTGERWASAGEVDWSRVWDSRTGKPLTPPLNHGGEVRWADWSPDGRRLLTAGLTPDLKVWDVGTGELLLPPLRLGSKPLEVGTWSPDGRFVVARSDERTVRVWDAATGEPVTPILQHDGYVRLARIVANQRLVTLSLPDRLRGWDLNEARLPADVITDYARLVSGRRFNTAGVTVPLSPADLAELCRSLRARAPELFQ